jgi:hypothetical protein
MTSTTTYRHSIEDITVIDEKINVTTTEKLTKTKYMKTTHLRKQATNLCTIHNVHSQHRINYVATLCFNVSIVSVRKRLLTKHPVYIGRLTHITELNGFLSITVYMNKDI